MMKKLLNLKEDYTLDLNETKEEDLLKVTKPLNEEVEGWILNWKNTIQTFTKNLFLQTLNQWLENKKGAPISQDTVEGIELVASEYGVKDKVVEILNQATSQNNTESQEGKEQTQLTESENGTTENNNQSATNTENQSKETENKENVENNENTSNENKEESTDAAIMDEVLKNLPVLIQDNLPVLVDGVKDVQIPPPEETKKISNVDELKNFLTTLTDEKALQDAFTAYEERIKDIEPKPVDEEKLTNIKSQFKVKDDYLGDVEKAWQKYMQAVNNNSETGKLLEMKNLLNAVHNFNLGGKPETPSASKGEPEQEGSPENTETEKEG